MRTIHISLFAVMSTLAVGLSDCSCNKAATGREGEGEGATAGEGEGATAGEGEGATAGEGEGATAGEGEGEGGGCQTDTDCNSGQVCLAATHTCGALPCTNNAQCGTGQTCDTTAGSCVGAACTTATQATDCGTGKVCDTTTGTCVGAPCTSNADCGGTLVCFADGTCGNSPITDPYQAFCLGTGSIVGGAGIGSGNICGGQLAQQTFSFAMCTCGDFTASGSSNLNIDSFDSSVGAYGGTNIGSDGNLGVDGQTTINMKPHVKGDLIAGGGSLTLPGSNSNVEGDLYCFGDADGGGATPVGRDAFVSGTATGFHITGTLFSDVTSDDTATAATKTVLTIPQVTPCPCDPSQQIDVAGIVDFGAQNNDNAVVADSTTTPPTPALDPDVWAAGQTGPAVLTLPCGRFYIHAVDQAQGLTLHATARTVLFVDGDFIANSLQVQLDQDAEVDIFIKGNLNFGSAVQFGDVTHPSGVRTYVGGSGGFVSTAHNEINGLIYAPNEDVTFQGSVDIFGAFFVHNANFGGTTNIHFDSSVRSAGQECPVAGEGEGEGEGATAGEGEGASAGEGEGAAAGEGEGAAGEGEGASAGEGEGEGSTSQCQQCDPTNVCGGEACIITNGTGTCGPCRTALDCCFPEICSSTGTCIFAGG